MIIRVSLISESSFYRILFISFILFLLSGIAYTYDNGTVVVYDNSTTAPYDYDNNTSKKTQYYNYYPVSIARELDVTHDVNNQLKGSGFIFLPNSPGDVFPIGDAENEQNVQEYDIQNIKINGKGGE